MNRLLRLGSLALLACGILLGSLTLNAQTIERRISYQGLLTQPNGQPIADAAYTLVLRFYDDPTGGNLVYEEQQNVNVQAGLFNVLIGSATPLAGVDFNQQLWLETAIVGQTPFLPRTRLAVVPYAIKAENAVVADSISNDFDGYVRSLNGGQGDLTIKGESGITVTRDGDTIRISGTIGGGSIEEITSQDGTIDVANPNGPITDLGVADGAITEEKIADGAVTNTKLGDNAVGTTKIQDASITGPKIAPGVIPTTLPPSGPAGGDLTGTYPDPLIRQNAVTTDKIADGQVRTADIADGNVVESKIGDGAVSTQKIQIGAVTNDRLADNSVSTSKIVDENVTSAKLSKTGVTPGIYGSDLLIPRVQVDDRGRITQITQVSIPDIPFTGPASGDLTGTYPAPTIRPGAVTNTKIADGAVGSSKIQDNSITTDKIANGTIKAEDIAPGVIPTTLPPSGPAGGVLAGTYPNPSIRQTEGTQVLNAINNPATSGTLNDNRLNTTGVTAGTYGSLTQIPIVTVDQYGRLTNVGTATLGPSIPAGPAGGDLNGTYPNPTVRSGAITTVKLADGSVTNAKLADDAVGSDNIIDNSITLDDIAPGVIPTELPPIGPAGGDLTGTYPNPTVKSGAITTAKLADGSVTNAKLADNSVDSDNIVDNSITAADIAPGVIPTTLPPSGPAGGALSGTYPDPDIATSAGTQILTALNNNLTVGTLDDELLNTTGIAAGTYGDGLNGLIPEITVDIYGRITAVDEQAVLSAVPSGPAGGDLQGTYPNPLINPSAAAGSRMVDAIRTDFLAGDADINTPNNVVVLDGSNRLPAADGSLITNLDASKIGTGVLPISRGGTNSGSPLVNNRLMWSNNGQIVEAPPLSAGQFFIGSSATTAPAAGTVVAGSGIDVTFTSPNLVITNTNAKVLPGTADNQTVRWDALNQQWVPNSNTTATSSGDLQTRSLIVLQQSDLRGSTMIGSNDGTQNSMGQGKNTVNSIGDPTSVNWMYGETNINTNTNAPTFIGSTSNANSSTTISVGSGGNLTFNGIVPGTPERFLILNPTNQVRTANGSALANEGIVFENSAFRLGGSGTNENPFLKDRYISLDVHRLTFNRLAGSQDMMFIDAGSNEINLTAITNINTTGAQTTTIGNPVALTTIGGQLDPRGNITNNVGDVVIVDETKIIGRTEINIGNDEDVLIGNQTGTNDQQIILSVGQGANGYLFAKNIKEDPTPLYMMTEDVQERVRKKLLADMADEGIQYQNGAFRLGTGESTPNYLTEKSYDENRFVNLDDFAINWTDGDEATPGTMFVQFDGNDGGAPLVTVEALSNINRVGAFNTNIGNLTATTTIDGTVNVNTAVLGNTTIGTNGNLTNINSSGINVGANGYTTSIQIGAGDGSNASDATIGIGQAPVGGYLMSINGTAQTNAAIAPNVQIEHLGGQAFNAAPYVNDADNGVIIGNLDGELAKWDENIFLNPFAWRVIGNDHPITDGVNNLLGTLDAENVRMITDGNNALVISGADQTIGIGADPTGDAQVEITAATGNNGLAIDAFSNGGVNGIEIDAPGAGILLNANGTPGVVGVSMDGTTTGLLIQNATTSMDVEGTAYINDNYNSDVYINTSGSTGNTQIGGTIGIPPQTRLVVDNVIDVRGSSYNINGRPVYRVNGNNFLWEGAGGDNNTMVGNTGNTAISGPRNTAVGAAAMRNMSTGAFNTAIGSQALFANSTGGSNVAVGLSTLFSNTGSSNTAVGTEAGNNNVAGNNNTLLGWRAGNAVLGSGNVLLGYNVGGAAAFAVADNNLAIDNSGTTTPLIYGRFDTDQLTFNVGTTAASLLVPGTAQTNASVNPNVRIGHLGGAAFDNAPYVDDANNGIITSDVNGDLYKWDEETVIGAFAWLLGGNTAPSSNVLGTLDGTSIDVQTNGTTALTVSGTDQQVTVANNGAVSLQVDGVGGTSNIRATSLSSNGAAYNAATDGIVVADNAGNLRRTALPGELIFGRKQASETRAAGVLSADADMTATAGSIGEFEIEVYIQYSGDAFPASALDFSLTSAEVVAVDDISYGVVSSGQAVTPSNVDGSGSIISGIGVSVPPTNRQTILVKGYVAFPAGGGTVTLHWGDGTASAGESITIHKNSYIKLTRNQ